MPLTKKGTTIMSAMAKEYGAKAGKKIFYASKNFGKISKVDHGFYGHDKPEVTSVDIGRGHLGESGESGADCY